MQANINEILWPSYQNGENKFSLSLQCLVLLPAVITCFSQSTVLILQRGGCVPPSADQPLAVSRWGPRPEKHLGDFSCNETSLLSLGVMYRNVPKVSEVAGGKFRPLFLLNSDTSWNFSTLRTSEQLIVPNCLSNREAAPIWSSKLQLPIHFFCLQNKWSWGWTDDPVVKNPGCPSRGQRFSSQHPLGGSQIHL